MKTLTLILKALSVLTGLAAYADAIPVKYAPLAVLVFALASTLKDFVRTLGDWLDDKKINGSFNPDKLPLLLVLAGLGALCLAGCASVDSGSRAAVVRAEQSITVANATFNTAVHIDDANRAFFRTNAPAFHGFCEWLRAPVVLAPLTNTLPRGLAIVTSANAVKNRYKATNATNDFTALISSIAVVETATLEAQKFIINPNAK